MTLEWWNPSNIMMFLLVLTRISGLFVSAPVLSNQDVPAQVKLGVNIVLSFIIFSLHMSDPLKTVPRDMIQFTAMAFQEFLVGAIIGFSVRTLLSGFQMAGELVSTASGLTVSNIMDPLTQTNVPVISQFYFFMAMLMFLSLNMHEAMLLAVNKSYAWFPIGGVVIPMDKIAERIMLMTSNMYVVALMMAMPVFSVILVTEVALAFTTKVMPQMNIFMVALPFKIMLALVMLILSLPSTAQFITDQYDTLQKEVMVLMKI
jgi:flagellar biosynthetic protein FliR